MSTVEPTALPRFHRLTDLPGVPAGERAADTLAEQLRATRGALLPALAGAHAAAEPVAVAWLHPDADADLHLLLGGGIAPEGGGRGPVTLTYPPGAHGVPVSPDRFASALHALPFWVRCPGVADALTAESPQSAVRQPDALFDDYAAALLDVPFGWLVVAEPVGRAEAEGRLAVLSREVPRLRGLAATAELQRVALERAQSAFREISRTAAAGLWRVHVLAGGADRPAALRIAGLLSAAADVAALPYALRSGTEASDFATTWRTPLRDDAAAGAASPFLGSTELLAAVARPPVREIRGVRVPPAGDFDITPEHQEGLELGTVLDRGLRPAGRLRVTHATLNRHVFVCGATGSGKSQTVRSLLERLHGDGIPWLVIEPAKAEYARMAGRIAPAEVLVIRPGRPDAVPAGLNPLEPEPGFPLQTHLDLVRALFLAAFDANEPFPQVLGQALQRCYTALGWNLATGESRLPGVTPPYPTLADLRAAGLRAVADIGYSERVTSDVRGFIDVRINSLRLGTPGRFFAGGHRLDIAELLRRDTVLELEDIGNDQDKAFLIGTVLIRLTEHLRQRAASGGHDSHGLRHVTVVEEAHRLLKATEQNSPAAHAVELFAALLAEIRAYGEGIIVAEQIPAKVTTDLVKNTALKIMHRLPAADDRATVGATMNLRPQQSEYVVTLPPGIAAVFADGMDRPVLARMPYGEEQEDAAPATRIPPLAAHRSSACGSLCRKQPCTLRDIDGAEQLTGHPQLALWIELLTIAHLIGRPEPVPRPEWLTAMGTVERRTRECAIGHLAQAAVERRYLHLLRYYQPEELAAHVAARAGSWFTAPAEPCAGDETRWQAGPYRYTDVARHLAHGDHDTTRPHPLTGDWFERGLDLRGLPIPEQAARLRRIQSAAGDRTAIDGPGTPPEHSRLAALLAEGRSPAHRLLRATAFLDFASDWPVRHLHPQEMTQWTNSSPQHG